MEQEQKQNPEIERIALSMQRMAHEYAKQIITRQLDVKAITVGSTNGFELTLTDKRINAKFSDLTEVLNNPAFTEAAEKFAEQVRALGYDGTCLSIRTKVGVEVTLKM